MAVGSATVERIRRLLADVLSIEVPTNDTDLAEAGLLDSLALVTLIAEVEYEFQVELPLGDLDVDRFRSVDRIAEFLAEIDGAAR